MPKYKYSGFKTKAHPKGDFRTQKPKLGTVAGGRRISEDTRWGWITVCDEFLGGRWEGFVSVRGSYKTKAEALRHRPKW